MRPTDEASFDELEKLSRVPLDEAMDALGHGQRRKLLFELLEQPDDAPVTITGSREWAESSEKLVATYHAHLPKLADQGFIDWNRDTDEVSRGENFDDIEPLLELLIEYKSELPENWL